MTRVRRSLRILLNAATVLSLLVCVAAAVLWVRSYRATDVVAHRGHRLWQVVVGAGHLFVQTVGYVERAGERVPQTVPSPGPRPAPFIRYTDTPGSYLEWEGRPGPAPRPRARRWALRQSGQSGQSGQSAGWLRTTEPAGRGLSASLVEGPAVVGEISGRWPGTWPIERRLGGTESMQRDRTTGAWRTWGTEQLLTGRTVWVPLWWIVAATAPLPAGRLWWLWAAWRAARRRARANCCTACGYDLRATLDRCPECGRVPEPRTNQTDPLP